MGQEARILHARASRTGPRGDRLGRTPEVRPAGPDRGRRDCREAWRRGGHERAASLPLNTQSFLTCHFVKCSGDFVVRSHDVRVGDGLIERAGAGAQRAAGSRDGIKGVPPLPVDNPDAGEGKTARRRGRASAGPAKERALRRTHGMPETSGPVVTAMPPDGSRRRQRRIMRSEPGAGDQAQPGPTANRAHPTGPLPGRQAARLRPRTRRQCRVQAPS